MKIIKFLLLGIILVIASNNTVKGCVCVGPDGAKDALKNWSDVIFSGEVISNEKMQTDSVQVAFLTFKIERVWKGVAAKEIVVRDYNVGLSCAVADFKVGERYIVFANTKNYEGKPFTDSQNGSYISLYPCNFTANLNNPKVKKKILNKIGKGKPVK